MRHWNLRSSISVALAESIPCTGVACITIESGLIVLDDEISGVENCEHLAGFDRSITRRSS
jgi:hypothetical protein